MDFTYSKYHDQLTGLTVLKIVFLPMDFTDYLFKIYMV